MFSQDDGTYAVAGEVEGALKAAEGEIVGDFCRWLAEREERICGQLLEAQEGLDRQRETLMDLQRQHQELVLKLDRILRSYTWRTRTLVIRGLSRIRHPL